jgi:hypothetical protein
MSPSKNIASATLLTDHVPPPIRRPKPCSSHHPRMVDSDLPAMEAASFLFWLRFELNLLTASHSPQHVFYIDGLSFRPKRQPPVVASREASIFSRTIRSASDRVPLPPSISFIIRSATTLFASAASIIKEVSIRASDRPIVSSPKTSARPHGGVGLSLGRLLDELMQRIGQFAVFIGAALAQLLRNLFGNVANPTFRNVETDDANRVAVLAF